MQPSVYTRIVPLICGYTCYSPVADNCQIVHYELVCEMPCKHNGKCVPKNFLPSCQCSHTYKGLADEEWDGKQTAPGYDGELCEVGGGYS